MRNAARAFAALAVAGAVAGCAGSQTPVSSGNVYQSSEANRVMTSTSCVVQSARLVALVGDSGEDEARNMLNTGIGAITGALIGEALGEEISSAEKEQKLGGQLGALGGAVLGANIAGSLNADKTTRQGVEYFVQADGRGEMGVIQHLNDGEVVLGAGSRCRLVGTRDSMRVLPG